MGIRDRFVAPVMMLLGQLGFAFSAFFVSKLDDNSCLEGIQPITLDSPHFPVFAVAIAFGVLGVLIFLVGLSFRQRMGLSNRRLK